MLAPGKIHYCCRCERPRDGNAVLQYVVIAQNGVLVDIAERTDNVVVTEFCLWVNER